MSFIRYIKKSAFDDNFEAYGFENYENLARFSTISTSNTNVSIRNSVFRECRSNDHGGALKYSGHRLLIEETTFINCSTSYHYGGAVYASCQKSVLNKICAFECFARFPGYSSNGHAFFISVTNNPLYNNYINYSSISNSKNTDTSSYHAQFIRYGRILLTNENISMNECYYQTALYSESSHSAYITYCTFANNTARYYGCLQFNYPHEMRECNILFNEQIENSTAFIIYSTANLFILNSCILENNKGKMVFYETDSSLRIALYNCTIDNDIISSKRYYNSLTIHLTNERAFINGNKHLIMNLCGASFDAVGTLTAPIEYKGVNSGLSLALNRNANRFSLNGMNIAKYLFINSFLSYD
jgi:hypothetical protein